MRNREKSAAPFPGEKNAVRVIAGCITGKSGFLQDLDPAIPRRKDSRLPADGARDTAPGCKSGGDAIY